MWLQKHVGTVALLEDGSENFWGRKDCGILRWCHCAIERPPHAFEMTIEASNVPNHSVPGDKPRHRAICFDRQQTFSFKEEDQMKRHVIVCP
jgi:hypothetical protein